MAEPISSRELVRAVAAEFDDRGWDDPEDLAVQITNATAAGDRLDPDAAAGLAPESFLERNETSRDVLRAALARLFAGRTFQEKDQPDSTYIDRSVKIGDNNTFTGNINTGEGQVVLSENSSPAELLAAVGDFVATAVERGFSPAEMELLDRLLEARQVKPGEIETAARGGLERSGADAGRLAEFRDKVLAGAATGLAVQGIMAALGLLL